MNMHLLSLVFVSIQSFIFYYVFVDAEKNATKYEHMLPETKHDNPNFVRDRWRRPNSSKPQMPESWDHRNKQKFHPAWMDYCDPLHCNDYHKLACGLNRDSTTFKWFQSQCHLILNNQCAYHRGLMKFDIVDSKFCTMYVLQVRTGCPQYCDDVVDAVCAVTRTNTVMLFKNPCALEMANCGAVIEPYQQVYMDICEYYLNVSTFI